PEAREHLKEGFEKGTEKGIEYFSEFDLPDNQKVVINKNLLKLQHENHIIDLIDPPNDGLVKHLMSFNFGVKEARKPFYFVIVFSMKFVSINYFLLYFHIIFSALIFL
ncbi:unnamed protein product, partial [marine sediment metagenome]